MDKDVFVNRISGIVDNFSYTPFLYALLFLDGTYKLKRIKIDESLERDVKVIADEWMKSEIFNENFELKNVDFIDENEKIFYGLDNYDSKLTFPKMNFPSSDLFNEDDQINLVGLLVKINKDNDVLWLYQHKYKMTRMDRKSFLYAVLNGENCYESLEKDIFRIDHKFDFVIVDDYLAAKNWKLLQQNFGFEIYVRSVAAQYVDGIEQMGIVADMTTLREYSNDYKFAKKIMKLKDSKVLTLDRETLLNRVFAHPYYFSMLTKDQSSGNIKVATKKAVTNLLKMLNDSILHSQLTDVDYESANKTDVTNN